MIIRRRSNPSTQDEWLEKISLMKSPGTQHFCFLHYVLGESFMDAFWISRSADDGTPLTVDTMRYILERWSNES